MGFRVELTSRAGHDADTILDWLATQHAGETGKRWVEALEGACTTLQRFPRGCALAPESKVFPFEVCQLLYGHKPHVYRILFTIEAETVYVLHIRHGRRQPLKP